MLAGLCVSIKENIHVVALDAAAAVLCGVDDTADHDLASVRNDARVHGNGTSGGCDGAGAGVAAPALGALSAWTVAGGAEEAEGFKPVCSWFPSAAMFSAAVWEDSPFT